MSFGKGARLIAHLIALSCFSAFFFSDYFQWGWALLGMFLIGASFFPACVERPGAERLIGRRPPLSPRVWNRLSFCFCLFFVVDLLFLSRALLPASLHFLIYLMAYRLFHLEKAKDHLQLSLIGFLQLLGAAGSGERFGYAISFSLSSVFLIWGLLAQHFKREGETRAPLSEEKRFTEIVPLPFFLMTNLLAAASLVLTLLIFFLIPRVGIGLFQSRESEPRRISGFSEKVDFGSMGPIKLDPSLVMRVLPSDAQRRGGYLRGMVFDVYDGLAWKSADTRKRDPIRESAPASSADGPLFKETILLEPLETSVLFTSGSVHALRGNFQTLLRDPAGVFYLPAPPTHRVEYEMAFTPRRPSRSDREATRIGYPPEVRTRDLSIAAGPRVAVLAREITASAPTVYQKAEAIERYLRDHGAYSLEVAPSPHPPLEDFLFFQKKGYCEHYATAMVALLRSVGIASRLVTGFLPGEWNVFGKYYIVRQSDAHAWVEVYFPEGGWIPFDPTPAVAADASFPLKAAAAYLDWMRLKWDRYIIRYSLLDQFVLLQGSREWIGLFFDRASEAIAKGGRAIRLLSPRWIEGGAALCLLAGVFLFFKRRRRGGGETVSQREAASVYHRMLRAFKRRGLVKRESETPLEFMEGVQRSARRSWAPAQRLTEIYCQVRFGEKILSAEEASRMETLLKEIERPGAERPIERPEAERPIERA